MIYGDYFSQVHWAETHWYVILIIAAVALLLLIIPGAIYIKKNRLGILSYMQQAEYFTIYFYQMYTQNIYFVQLAVWQVQVSII